MATLEKIIDKIWAVQNESQKANQAVQQQQAKIVVSKKEPEKSSAQTKKVTSGGGTDTRSTAQKVADAQTAYDLYMASEERKRAQQEQNRKRLQAAINNAFAAPGTSVIDMPLNIVSPKPEADAKEKELKTQLDYYKGQQQKEENLKIMEADLKEYESWSDADRAAMEFYAENRPGGYQSIVRSMNAVNAGPGVAAENVSETSAKAEAAYQQLVAKYGESKVKNIAESLERFNNEKAMEDVATFGANSVADNAGAAAGHSVATVATNLGAGFAGMIGLASQIGTRTGRYSTLDPNNQGNALNTYSGAVRGQVVQDIRGEDANIARKALAVAYQSGMVLADVLARGLLAGSTGAATIAATSTFAHEVSEASRRGATPEQAVAVGFVKAAVEALSEKIPMDEIFKAAKAGNLMLLRNGLRQAGIEIATEELSILGSVLADEIIMGEKTDRRQRIGELVAAGMSYEDAKKQANKEFKDSLFAEMKNTAWVSGLAGFASGGGAALVGNINNKLQEQQVADQAAAPVTEAQPAQESMTQQQAVDEQAAKILAQMPKAEPEQKTPGQMKAQQAVNEVVGVENAKPETEVRPQAEARTETTAEAAPVQNIPEVQNEITQEPGIKGTGAAEANLSGKAAYQDLLTDDNVQRSRPDDVRNVKVPKVDSYGRNVSEFVGNAVGAEITPDKMVNTIEELVQEGALGFDRRRNQDALNDAAKEIEQKGANNVRRQITNAVANGKIRDGDIEKAMLLYSSYANKNGQQAMDIASELFVDLETMAHMTGRNLQLFKLIRKLTPEGQAMAIKKTVERSVENMIRSGQVKKGYTVEIDPGLMKQYKDAAAENARAVTDEQKEASAEKMQKAQQAIMASEAAKMPSTMKAKWDAWRYMSMLGNVKTQARNIGGNVAMMPYKDIKDKMAAIFEKALPKEQRTKSFFNDTMLMEWAAADAKSTDVQNALKYSGKLGDDITSAQFAENRKVFDNDALEAVRKFVEKLPQAGDMIFKNRYYEKSLAGFLKARGYSYDAVVNGQVSDAVMAEARGYAIQEAMKATFNDSNAFSDAIASIGRKNTDNPWSKALNVAAEGILPFRRTPANIVVRFTEYSPVGLAKGVWDMATKVKDGNLSAAAALDQISAGMTGSMVMALGYFLANGIAGVKITGSGTEDDEKRQGHQDYALEFSINGQEYSYKIDWAAPANLPLFVGANIQKMMEDKGGDTDVSWFMSFVRGMGTMFEPMLALSCLSSLNDLVEGARYAPEGEALYSIATDIATSYFTQGIPALLRQTYQASQKNKQTTFANSSDPTIRDLQKVGANIPFVGGAFQTDKVNEWGETETTESAIARAFNAFVNPGTFKTIDNGELETEISRLNEAGFSVSPPTVAKTASYTDASGKKHTDVRLTEEQYQAMAKTQGQRAAKLLDQMITRSDYQKLTDAQKADAIKAVYEYAEEQGRKAAFGNDYHSNADAWIRSANGNDPQFFINRGAMSTTERAVDNVAASLKNGWKVTDADKKELAESYNSYAKLSSSAQQRVMEESNSATAKYLEIRSAGVGLDDYLDALKNLKKVDGNKDAQVREAIANANNSPDVTDKIMLAYMTDYDPNDEKPDKTELRYQYARQKLGMSAQDYAKAYKAYTSGSTKAEKINALVSAGFSKKDADTLYKLFKGSTDVVSWYNSK